QTPLKEIELRCHQYKSEIRFIWGSASDFEITLSIRDRSYLSHASAAYLHGLTQTAPPIIYVNREQGRKGQRGILSQEGIHHAFRSNQRSSRQIYTFGDKKILLISGKNTGRLEVTPMPTPTGEFVDATRLER